jgi:signal transduction histidine kinase
VRHVEKVRPSPLPGIGLLPKRTGPALVHHGGVGVSGTRVGAWAAPALPVAALVAGVAGMAGGFLLDAAAPYLGPWDVWPLPLVATAYAVVAAYVATTRPRPAHLTALLVTSVGVAVPALSLGLAQRSWSWVGIGALASLAAPAVGWVCGATLRGEAMGRLPRRLLTVAAALAAARAVVRTLVDDPAGWGWCRCARNPLAVTSGSGPFERLEPWLAVADLAVVALVVLAVGTTFWERPGRRGAWELALVVGLFAVAGAWVVGDLALLAGRPTSDAEPALAVGLLIVLVVHLAGLRRGRPSRAHVADLLLAARERSEPARLRELVARAVGDPGAAVYWWDRDAAAYVDHRGQPAVFPEELPPAHVLDVESERRPIARVVTERPLVEDLGIRGPVAEALRLSTENRLLQEELAASLVQVRESRSRIVQASDETRRRIERDLHDGAQQLLISTGAKLNLASARIDPARDPGLADALAEASDELGRALSELRSLARGITPTALVHGSLADALEDLALRSPVPATLHVTGTAAVHPEAQATAYFVVAESLANVARHADATSVQVVVALDSPVHVEVRDDGHGGADPAAGSGLKGLLDRVEALGGDLTIQTSGAGTTVAATVPNDAA